MKTDIEIARETKLKKIVQIADGLGIKEDDLVPYGKYIAKVPYTIIDEDKIKKHKLILVTAITPTKAGIGKTTVSVGLALGMQCRCRIARTFAWAVFRYERWCSWWRLCTSFTNGRN